MGRPRQAAAGPALRSLAFVLDAVALFLLGAVVILAVALFSLPFLEVAPGVPTPRDPSSAWDAQYPHWSVLLAVGLLSAGAVALSGALSKARVSPGLRAGELHLAPTYGAGPPPRWRVAARWLVPILLVATVTAVANVLAAVILALLGWLPCLVRPRRSVYDWAAGLVVIDPDRHPPKPR